MNKETLKKEDITEKWTLKRLLWTISVVWLILGLLMYFISPSWVDRGTLGDMFGSINALFAGLAFAGIIYTIAIQRKELTAQTDAVKMQTEELSLQREAIEIQTEELKMQREELSRSADQLEQQRKLMNFQIILGTLNGMLAVKKEAINNIRYSSTTVGLAVFNYVIRLRKNRQDHLAEDLRNEFNYYLSVYFDIIQYIIHSELDPSQKEELIHLLFTHTNTEEAAVLLFFSENNQHRLMLLDKVRLGDKVKSRELSKNGYDA